MNSEKWFSLKGRRKKKKKQKKISNDYNLKKIIVNYVIENNNNNNNLKSGEFKINAIVHREVRNSRLKYLINWKDWPDSKYNTWEPACNLLRCVPDVKAFDTFIFARNKEERTISSGSTISVIENNASIRKKKELNLNPEVFKAIRLQTEQNEQLTHVLAYHIKSRITFVQWSNCMVTTLQLEVS